MKPYDVLEDVHAFYWETQATGGKLVSLFLFVVLFLSLLFGCRLRRVVSMVKNQDWALA